MRPNVLVDITRDKNFKILQNLDSVLESISDRPYR